MSHARPEDASEPEAQDLKFVDVTTAQGALSCQCEPEMPHLKPVSVAHRHQAQLEIQIPNHWQVGSCHWQCRLLVAAARDQTLASGPGSDLKAAGSPSIAKVEFYRKPAFYLRLQKAGPRKWP